MRAEEFDVIARIKTTMERFSLPISAIVGLIVLYCFNAMTCFFIYQSLYSLVPVFGMPLIFAICGVVLFAVRKKIHVNQVLLFTIALAVLGLFYMAIFPPFMVPDSLFHYRSAYAYSNILMGLPAYESSEMPMRVCDIEFLEAFAGRGIILDHERYAMLGDSAFWLPEDSSVVWYAQSELNKFSDVFGNLTIATFPSLESNPFQTRIIAALGITLGRLFGLGALPVFYLGELFNLALYCTLATLAVRIIPAGKKILMAICLLPMALHLGASYSYDVAIIGFSFVFIALVVRAIKVDEPISPQTLIGIVVLAVLLAPCKVVYSVLVLLVFMIPACRFKQKSFSWLFKSGVIVVACLSVMAFQLPSLMNLAANSFPAEQSESVEVIVEESAPAESENQNASAAESESNELSQAEISGGDSDADEVAEVNPTSSDEITTQVEAVTAQTGATDTQTEAAETADTQTEAATIQTEAATTQTPIKLGYLLEHPGYTAELVLNTLKVQADDYLGTAIGSRLGWLDAYLAPPWWFIMLFIGLLVVAMLPRKTSLSFSFKERAGFLTIGVLTILAVLFTFAITLSYIEDCVVAGVQGRYFLPALPLILLALAPRNTVYAKSDLTNLILVSSIALNMMYLSYIFAVSMIL